MPVDAIRDVRDAVSAAEESVAHFSRRSPWWRGHANAGWTLVPKVHRPPKGNPNRESNLALHFQAQAGTRRVDCPPRGHHPEWLFLMQHYGLATRLLDWTWSPLTALFFAVGDPRYDAEIGALWALNPGALNKAQGLEDRLPVPEAVRELFDDAFTEGARPSGKVVAVATHEVDLRMMVQLSAFTVHDTETPLEQVVGDHSAFLRRYEVPPSAKPVLRGQLELLAIDLANLFPDLEHLATDLNRKIR